MGFFIRRLKFIQVVVYIDSVVCFGWRGQYEGIMDEKGEIKLQDINVTNCSICL